MKALVTGGAGFIGSHVAKSLLKEGYDVVVLDDLSGGNRSNVPQEARFIKGSITDYELLQQLFTEERFDYVFHLAAYAAEGLSHFIRRYNYQNNLIGSTNLINQSILHQVKCFVFTSSIAVYGAGQVPMTEALTPQPEDPYGVAKYAVELDLKAAHEQFGLDYIIFRPHNVYGEGQNAGDKYRNVIGIFMNLHEQGKPFTIFGDGKQTRDFIYVGDIADTCITALEGTVTGACNIATGTQSTLLDLIEVLSGITGNQCDVTHDVAREGDIRHSLAVTTKMNTQLGVHAETSLRDGLIKLIESSQ